MKITKREGWMDSVDFQHEVGSAIGGNTVYPDQEEVEALPCIKEGDYCKPKRVYVVDADEFDASSQREISSPKDNYEDRLDNPNADPEAAI